MSLLDPDQSRPCLHPHWGNWLEADLLPALGSTNGGMARYISPDAGDPAADGSPSKPFNPTSAAAGFGGDPMAQAIASLPAPTSQADEDALWFIMVRQGFYTVPWTINTGFRQLWIWPAGFVFVAPGMAITRQVSLPAFGANLAPSFYFGSTEGEIQAPLSSILVGDGGVGVFHTLTFERQTGYPTVGVIGAQAGGLSIYARNSWFGDMNLPTAAIWTPLRCFFRAITADTLVQPIASWFSKAITLVSPSADPFAWVGNNFTGGPWVFTAPAGSALFDHGSAESFRNAGGCTFAGGAGIADFEDNTEVRSAQGGSFGPAAASLVFGVPSNMTLTRISFRYSGITGANSVTATVSSNGVNMLSAASYDLVALGADTLGLPALNPTEAQRQLLEGRNVTVALAFGAGTSIQNLVVCPHFTADTRPIS